RRNQGLGCGSAEANQDLRVNRGDFDFEPGAAGADLGRGGALMDARLAALDEAEVLHHVGDVNTAAIDSGFTESVVEDAAGGTDEGMSGEVLEVAGLLADQHQRGGRRTFAEDGLSRLAIEIAILAVLDRAARLCQ